MTMIKEKAGKDYWEKVGANIFANCNQKCQEEVSSKTHYQGTVTLKSLINEYSLKTKNTT